MAKKKTTKEPVEEQTNADISNVVENGNDGPVEIVGNPLMAETGQGAIKTASIPAIRSAMQNPIRKRIRIRKKGPKKLSVAVLCSNIGFSRFA